MAAAAKARQSLQDEASCSICLEYFNDPVTIDCGHNFCRACITQCWEGSDKDFSCPQCRTTFPQRNLRPNRQLANMVEIAKQLHLQSTKDAGAGRACEKHQEALKLFCREDQSPICVVCDRSKEHRAHTVVPAEEAAQEYKGQIRSRLEMLKKEMEGIAALKLNGEITSQELLQQTESERMKILSEFEKLHLFLEEKELLLLAQLEVLDKEILKRQDEFTMRLTQEKTRLGTLINEMEGKCRQPPSEFLQDIRSTLSRYETGKFQSPPSLPLELKRRVKEFSQKHTLLEHALSKFKESLSEPKLDKVHVTLDPDTAHPHLILSEDGTSVRWGPARQDVPDNFRRFDPKSSRNSPIGGRLHYPCDLLIRSSVHGWRENVCCACISHVVELGRLFILQSAKDPEAERVCENHQEEFALLFEEGPTTHLCDLHGAQRNHVTASTETAAEQCKEARDALNSREKGKVQAAMALSPEPRQRTPEFSLNPQTLRQFKVNVTLDPDTAGPELILSEDLKGARWGKPSQEMPDRLERFDTDPCVLGCEGFTSGRHYWEVEVDGMFWTVGVASESVRRKGRIVFRPNMGVLGLQKYHHLCVALTNPSNTYVPLKKNNNEIGVYLDYELGRVSFYDLSNEELLFAFPPVSFNGERVFPYFCVLLSHIKLSPRG
ncbi:unnamed protein product [Natator depressus]